MTEPEVRPTPENQPSAPLPEPVPEPEPEPEPEADGEEEAPAADELYQHPEGSFEVRVLNPIRNEE